MLLNKLIKYLHLPIIPSTLHKPIKSLIHKLIKPINIRTLFFILLVTKYRNPPMFKLVLKLLPTLSLLKCQYVASNNDAR